jgi:hypothetical protein
MLQAMSRARQLAAEPGAALAAHTAAAAELRCAAAAATALQQQVGMAAEIATVQACHLEREAYFWNQSLSLSLNQMLVSSGN